MTDESKDRGFGAVAGRMAGQVADRLAPLRDAGWRALGRREGAVASVIRKVNDALGRPLAPADELDDRRAFARGYRASFDSGLADARPAPRTNGTSPPPAGQGTGTGTDSGSVRPAQAEAAPVLVYFLDKQKRDVRPLTEILETHGVPYKLASLEEDPAAQAAVRRDSKGFRLPLVFIAGECVGGREQLLNLGATGQLQKLVFGT